MAQIIVNPASITIIHQELELTINQVAATFEASLERNNPITPTLYGLRQIRGVFRLLQLHDAAKLSDELLYTVNHFTTVDTATSSPNQSWITCVSEGFYVLSRYLDYIHQNKRALPGLLLPAINNLRSATGKSLLPESFFSEQIFDLERGCPVAGPSTEISGFELDLESVKRLRHMYQLGLLGVLRNQQTGSKLEMMHRAAGRMYTMCQGNPMGEFWWLIDGLLEGFKQRWQLLSLHRKRLLTIVDSQFKLLLQHGASACQTAVPPSVKKELLFLVSINDSQGARSREIRQTFDLTHPAYTDSELAKELKKFTGPSNDTFACVAQSIIEELNQAKLWMEDLAREGYHRLYCLKVIDTLGQLAAVLEFIELTELGQLLRKRLAYLQTWQPEESVDMERLLDLANAILCVEGVVSRMAENALWRSGSCQDKQVATLIAECHFIKAQEIVLKELQACLTHGKQAMVALEESSENGRAVEEIVISLHDAKGTLTTLNHPYAAAIIGRALCLLRDQTDAQYRSPETGLISALADVFVSLEFYLAELASENELPETLSLADESLGAIETSRLAMPVDHDLPVFVPMIPQPVPAAVVYSG